jgi:hypothetical protein
VGGPPRSAGERLGIRVPAAGTAVFPKSGVRQWLVGQHKPRESLPGREVALLFHQSDANAVVQNSSRPITEFRAVRAYQGDERAIGVQHPRPR